MAKVDTVGPTRRALLRAAVAGSAASASAALAAPPGEADNSMELIAQSIGRMPVESDRVRLTMPPVFPTGSGVPLSLSVDSPMTQADHVRQVRVLAPRNPIIEVATFHFMAERSEARVSTRIRLAEPQYVVAVAEMNDGALLMARTWVEVATNGCT